MLYIGLPFFMQGHGVPMCYDNHLELLNDPDIDAVYIAALPPRIVIISSWPAIASWLVNLCCVKCPTVVAEDASNSNSLHTTACPT